MRKRAIIPTADTKTSMFQGDRNTFGLLPGPTACGGTCPCATTGTGGCLDIPNGRATPRCYVFKTMAFRPAVHGVLKHNTDLLMNASFEEQVRLLSDEFERYYKSWCRYVQYTKPVNPRECCYRIHWAGDCFSSIYAHALRKAMEAKSGKMRFWGYSRSLFSIPAMQGLENCNWLISLDDMNKEHAVPYLEQFHPGVLRKEGNVGIAYMSDEAPDRFDLKPCPADKGEVHHAGACSNCTRCVRGESVWFKIK